MRNGRLVFILLALAGMVFSSNRSSADVLILRDGSMVKGLITEDKDDYVTVKIDDKEKVIRKYMIEDVEVSEGSAYGKKNGRQQMVRTKKVKFYMTTWCPYCRKMEEYLIASGIPFSKVDIESSKLGHAEYKELGGNGVPFLVINDTVISGYDPEGVQWAWDQWNRE